MEECPEPSPQQQQVLSVTLKSEGGKTPALEVPISRDTSVAQFVAALQQKLDSLLAAAPVAGQQEGARGVVSWFVPNLERECALEARVVDVLGEGEVVLELETEEEFERTTRETLRDPRQVDLATGAYAAAKVEGVGASTTTTTSGSRPKKQKRAAKAHSGEGAEQQEGVESVDENGCKVISMSSCHRCKTRKPLCFICPRNPHHRICPGCLDRHHQLKRMPQDKEVGCPVCTRQCTCAQCRKREAAGASAPAPLAPNAPGVANAAPVPPAPPPAPAPAPAAVLLGTPVPPSSAMIP